MTVELLAPIDPTRNLRFWTAKGKPFEVYQVIQSHDGIDGNTYTVIFMTSDPTEFAAAVKHIKEIWSLTRCLTR